MTPGRSLTDGVVVLTAAAAALGAFHPWDRALVVGAVVALLALRGPRVVLVPLAVALLTSGLAQRSLDGLDELEAGPVVGEVTLVRQGAAPGVDPEPDRGRELLHARLEGVVAAHRPQHGCGEVGSPWVGRAQGHGGHPQDAAGGVST